MHNEIHLFHRFELNKRKIYTFNIIAIVFLNQSLISFLSLIKNNLSTQRALYINIFVSAFAVIILSLIFNWWEMWLGIAIPVCFAGTAILSLFYKNYLFIVRPIPLLSTVLMLGFIGYLFASVNIMKPHEIEMRSYMTLDREMAKRIEAEREK